MRMENVTRSVVVHATNKNRNTSPLFCGVQDDVLHAGTGVGRLWVRVQPEAIDYRPRDTLPVIRITVVVSYRKASPTNYWS